MRFEDSGIHDHPVTREVFEFLKKSGNLSLEKMLSRPRILSAGLAEKDPVVIAASAVCHFDPETLDFDTEKTPELARVKAIVADMTAGKNETAGGEQTVEARKLILLAHLCEMESAWSDERLKSAKLTDQNVGSLYKTITNLLNATMNLPDAQAETDFETEALTGALRCITTLKEMAKTRYEANTFKHSGLPGHPLIEKIYNFCLINTLRVNDNDPTASGIDSGRRAAKFLADHLTEQDPELIATALFYPFFHHVSRDIIPPAIYKLAREMQDGEQHFSAKAVTAHAALNAAYIAELCETALSDKHQAYQKANALNSMEAVLENAADTLEAFANKGADPGVLRAAAKVLEWGFNTLSFPVETPQGLRLN